MSVAVLNIDDLYRDEDWTVNFVAASPPVNVTGWLMEFRVGTAEGTSDVLALNEGNSGLTVDTPTTGAGHLTVAKSATINIAPGMYFCELWRTQVDQVRLLAKGNMRVRA